MFVYVAEGESYGWQARRRRARGEGPGVGSGGGDPGEGRVSGPQVDRGGGGARADTDKLRIFKPVLPFFIQFLETDSRFYNIRALCHYS